MSHQQAFLRILGFTLLAALLGWIVVWYTHGEARHTPLLLEEAHAFNGNAQLPEAEIRKQLSAARSQMDRRYNDSNWTKEMGTGGDWLAFLLTALITLIAGYHGRVLPASASGEAAVAELVKGRSERFTRTVGLIAAAAAICTALSAKAKDASDVNYKDAVAIQTAAMNARKALITAPDASSAQDILDQLHQAVEKH
jgi:hypothetical protein